MAVQWLGLSLSTARPGSISSVTFRFHKQRGTIFLLKINNVSQEENRARKMLRTVPGMAGSEACAGKTVPLKPLTH